jgi:membrane protein implicated in regulation of membrane protease activity
MMMLNQVDDEQLSTILNLILLRYAVIVGGVVLLGVIALLVLRAWLRRGNRISDRTRERVHGTIDRHLSDRRAVRTIAHTTWDAVARDKRRGGHPS